MTAITFCTLDKIKLITVSFGQIYEGGSDYQGGELAEVQLRPTTDTNDRRQYCCTNCGRVFDGTDTFTLCREHLGGAVEKSDNSIITTVSTIDTAEMP